MESPVGTTYELRSHSLLPVGPRMTDKADSCGELSTAVITGKASYICGLGCGDGQTCRTFSSAALLYCSDNTNFLKVLMIIYNVKQLCWSFKFGTWLTR